MSAGTCDRVAQFPVFNTVKFQGIITVQFNFAMAKLLADFLAESEQDLEGFDAELRALKCALRNPNRE